MCKNGSATETGRGGVGRKTKISSIVKKWSPVRTGTDKNFLFHYRYCLLIRFLAMLFLEEKKIESFFFFALALFYIFNSKQKIQDMHTPSTDRLIKWYNITTTILIIDKSILGKMVSIHHKYFIVLNGQKLTIKSNFKTLSWLLGNMPQ